MLSTSTTHRLRGLGIDAQRAEQFAGGMKLLQLVSAVYYGGDNPALSSKVKWGDEQKTGNKVVNVNMILNYIKKDPNITLPPSIRELTAFRLIEQNETMREFVEFLLSQMPQQPQGNIEMSPPRQQENQFENLYFAASIGKPQALQEEDSLQHENRGETVVRKGSFKVLKPKMSSQSKMKGSQSKDSSQERSRQDSRPGREDIRASMQLKAQPLKEIYVVDNENHEEQVHSRKTIPKMHEKPPLYRSKQKEERERGVPEERKTPMVTASQTDRDSIIKNIENINSQIAEEERSLHLLNTSHQFKPEPPKPRSSRKVFKMDLPDIGQARKKALVEWLIGINILSLSAGKHALSLHSICKDGVVFMEVVNYYRGRGRNLCFFKEPKRPAQMHSNYQKLFSLLMESPDFKSQLTNQYEYFIPEAQPNAFWGLLSSIHACYCKQRPIKNTAVESYQSSIGKAVQRSNSRKKSANNESLSYQQVKFNSSSASKDRKEANSHNNKDSRDIRSNFSSIQLPRKQTPKPSNPHMHTNTHSHTQQSSQGEKAAPYGLVQNEQPVEQNVRTERGYKEMYLCKFKNLQTPSKNRSFSNSSLSRSRLRSSAESARKQEARGAPPSISLEMQMAVLKYLSGVGVGEEEELFRDPFRNGVLLCSIIRKEWGVDCFASRKPRSIDDCRNNFLTAIQVVRSRRKGMTVSYEYFVEDLVKGEKSLLYGLIWHVIDQQQQQPQTYPSQQMPFSHPQVSELNLKGRQQERIGWVRSIQRHSAQVASLKIRSEQTLFSAIINTDFLFHYAAVITGKRALTPNYEKAFNNIQRESNLKKALSYFIQHKIIRSDYLWRTKALLKPQNNVLQELLDDLVNHYNRLFKKEQMRTVNFVRYLRKEDTPQEDQRPLEKHEKLQTTMANQTLLQPVLPAPLQVNWMRKLGFTGSLQLNNGVLLCRVVAKLGMRTVQGVNEHPQSRAQCLGNIRRAMKQLPKFKWDEYDIVQADHARTLQVYAFLREQYRHSYAMKSVM